MLSIFEFYFKKTISQVISKDKPGNLSKDDFIVLYTALFGSSPLDEELNRFFKENEYKDMATTYKYLKLRFLSLKSIDIHILELFRALDIESKGYISCQDFIDAETAACKLPKMFLHYFAYITDFNNILDYFAFKDAYVHQHNCLWGDE